MSRRIAELRRERKLTQAALAEQLELALRYVQSVEGGRENLTLTSLAKFAGALQVPVSAFFERPTRAARGPGRPKKTDA